MMKGEKKYSRILIEEDDGNTFTVTSPLFDVVDDADSVVQAETSASIRNNTTAAVELYGLVDTTDSGFVDGSSYKVRFTFTIDDEVLKGVDPIKIAETRL
jgi:hypothetical protein